MADEIADMSLNEKVLHLFCFVSFMFSCLPYGDCYVYLKLNFVTCASSVPLSLLKLCVSTSQIGLLIGSTSVETIVAYVSLIYVLFCVFFSFSR